MATARAETAPAARAPAQPRGGFRGLTALLSFVAFLAAWQLLTVATGIEPILLPAPGSVLSELFEVWRIGILWPSVLDSLEALFVGLGAALVLGIVLGLLIGASRWLDLVA